jgi:hypothetical protein
MCFLEQSSIGGQMGLRPGRRNFRNEPEPGIDSVVGLGLLLDIREIELEGLVSDELARGR